MNISFISFSILFLSIWMTLIIFDRNVHGNKVFGSLLLSIIVVGVNFIGSYFGIVGILAAFITNVFIIKKLLDYSFFTALFFSLGINAISALIDFGVKNTVNFLLK